MADIDGDPAVSVCFSLRVDDHDLGTFTRCEGLGMEVEIEEMVEGGNQFFVHQLPGRIRYSNVTFTRVINGDSQKVAKWFTSAASGLRRTNAEIIAKSADGEKVIAQWGLLSAVPVRWTGPQLNSDTLSVATETLEIAHHGFIDPAKGEGATG